MGENRVKRANPLDRLSELLEDELLQATGEDLHEIAREWSVDPSKSAEAVDTAFKVALRRQKQAKLHEAKRVRDLEISKLAAVQQSLPTDRDQLIAMLSDRLATLRQGEQNRITVQHRSLRELTDDDLRGLLRDLAAVDNP
jgi:hypothetical protein